VRQKQRRARRWRTLSERSAGPLAPVAVLAGGVARARDAWRYSDGTLMSDREKHAAIAEYEIEEYERYAAGGRARAARAHRARDGTFLPGSMEGEP
jgi:hypothetical protein